MGAVDAGSRCEIGKDGVRRRGQALDHHPPGFHASASQRLNSVTSEVADVRRTGTGGSPSRTSCLAKVLPQPLGVGRRDAVDLVQDHRLMAQAPRPGAKVPVVEDGVLVLLRVRDPQHRIHPGQQGIDPGGMTALDRIEVREVEHRERIVLLGVVRPDLDAPEPVEERRRLGDSVGRKPGDGDGRRWPSGTGGR